MTAAPAVRARRALLALVLITAIAAIIGGALLVTAADGHLLAADATALSGTPFRSWQLPGLLLLVLIGGAFGLAAFGLARHARWAAGMSIAAGAGLVAFELAEFAWLGFNPLEALFAAVGLTVMVLAQRLAGSRTSHRPGRAAS